METAMLQLKVPAFPSMKLGDIPIVCRNGYEPGQWAGTTHTELLDIVHAEFTSRGWLLGEPKIYIGRGGADMACSIAVIAKGVEAPEGYHHALGLTNSNARQGQPMLYCGLVTPSGAGLALNAIPLGPHRKEANYPGTVHRAGPVLLEVLKEYPYIMSRLDHQPVGSRALPQILMMAGNKGWMPHSRVFRVYQMFLAGPKSAWRLLEAFAQVAGVNPPMKQFWQVLNFYLYIRNRDR